MGKFVARYEQYQNFSQTEELEELEALWLKTLELASLPEIEPAPSILVEELKYFRKPPNFPRDLES